MNIFLKTITERAPVTSALGSLGKYSSPFKGSFLSLVKEGEKKKAQKT